MVGLNSIKYTKDDIMANSAVFTNDGFNVLLDRGFNASTTSTVPTVFAIGISNTTALVTDSDLAQKAYAWSGANTFKAFVSGYPKFDISTRKVTTQGFIASTEANSLSSTITELGDFNESTPKTMSSRVVFTPISKTSTVQVYITTIFKRAS